MKKLNQLAIIVAIESFVLLFACSNNSELNNVNQSYFEASYEMNNLKIDTSLFYASTSLGKLENKQITEASGMAVSRQDTTMIWTHNDSGDFNRIFLVKNDGTYVGTFKLLGAKNRDWEDIAVGVGPIEGKNYLYVADIGDNKAQYGVKHIYRLPEPDITTANASIPFVEYSNDIDKISFTLPNKKKMDAESIMIDPWTKDIYVVTKRELPVVVYRLPFPQSTTETIVAEKYGTLPFTMATAGDISIDGTEIVLKTKDEIFLWTRNNQESIADAFKKMPTRLPYKPEPQGEAIAFSPDGRGYYTLSEDKGKSPKINFYRRK